MPVKIGFQLVVMDDQSTEIDAKKHNMYDDFSDASDVFVQFIEEETGEKVQRPKKLADASETINNVLYQIWRVEYPSK